MRTITFNELRRIKDSLPSGSMHRIADELNMTVETVRNFFGDTISRMVKVLEFIWNRDQMGD
mgnify:FL=1